MSTERNRGERGKDRTAHADLHTAPVQLGAIAGSAHMSFVATANLTIAGVQLNGSDVPRILLQALVIPGEKTTEGQIIEAVDSPWFEIVKLLQVDPDAIYQIHWRKWEEIIAGAYSQRGFDVVLTPSSGDKGRDIIATLDGLQIRIVDQVKAYKPGHLVTLDQVSSMLGVLTTYPNTSKGVVTTTSDFAPGIYRNDEIKRLMPYRLELKAHDQLLKELSDIAARSHCER